MPTLDWLPICDSVQGAALSHPVPPNAIPSRHDGTYLFSGHHSAAGPGVFLLKPQPLAMEKEKEKEKEESWQPTKILEGPGKQA